MRNHLVYYTVGGPDVDYVRLLEASVASLMETLSTPSQVDVLVMCDRAWSSQLDRVRDCVERGGSRFHEHRTPPNPTGVVASMRKLEIFDWPFVNEYNGVVLYLDCDIVVVRDVVSSILESQSSRVAADKLSVKNEDHVGLEACAVSMPSLINPTVVETLKTKGVKPFNCGQFAFRPSSFMEPHFRWIRDFVASHKGEDFYYEQSFMNHYFNHVSLGEATDRGTLLDSNAVLFPQLVVFDPVRFAPLQHVCNTCLDKDTKLWIMRAVQAEAKAWLRHGPLKTSDDGSRIVFEDRKAMMEVLIPVVANTTSGRPVRVMEIGVFQGHFAAHLLACLQAMESNTSKTFELHLIDPWTPEYIFSGDQDGNDVQGHHGDALFQANVAQFGNVPKVKIHRGLSSQVLPHVDDDSVDLIYVDGDHSYEGALSDIELSYTKIRRGGWLAGHDYDMNMAKTANRYEFGVHLAVTEFCKRHPEVRIDALAMDGCVSFAIRKPMAPIASSTD